MVVVCAAVVGSIRLTDVRGTRVAAFALHMTCRRAIGSCGDSTSAGTPKLPPSTIPPDDEFPATTANVA
jgi:hypothetical protein